MPHPDRLFVALFLSCLPLVAHDHPAVSAALATAASTWLQSLDPAQRPSASFDLTADERQNWHFIPKDRLGVSFKQMTPVQAKLARELVATGLSDRGRLTTEAIVALEDVLLAMTGAPHRDKTLYFFSIFGRPDPHGTWGWRMEGHHLSVNFLIVKGEKIAVTPMFFGSNPAEVRIEHAQKGRRALAAEEDLGRALMQALQPEQRRVALIAAQAPADILTGNDREARLAAPTGLAYDAMNPDQQARLRALVEVYAGRLRPELAAAEVQKIADAGWNQVHFAWAGGIEPGDHHYYRIHSPAFVIEYDNTQNDANHVHTSWRNFSGDFGRDLLQEHILESHSKVKDSK